jgi:outer membrane lipoprotein-sorting protein
MRVHYAQDQTLMKHKHVLTAFTIKIALLVLSFYSLLFSGCATGPDNKNIDISELITEAEKKTYLVKQFKAEFVKTRSTDIFKNPMTVEGSLVFQKPNSFRMFLRGDVNVEIISNGKLVMITHDGIDKEKFEVYGERDLSRMSDPLMTLLQGIGNGDLRNFVSHGRSVRDGSLVLEARPENDNRMERIRRVSLKITESGEIKKVVFQFKNGNEDETTFKSWRMLSSDDPEIVSLTNQLQKLSEYATSKLSLLEDQSYLDVGKYLIAKSNSINRHE